MCFNKEADIPLMSHDLLLSKALNMSITSSGERGDKNIESVDEGGKKSLKDFSVGGIFWTVEDPMDAKYSLNELAISTSSTKVLFLEIS